MPPRLIVPKGTVYGSLTVIKEVDPRRGCRHFKCQCACGNKTVACLVDMRRGHTSSCGCLAGNPEYHGLSTHPLYKAHRGMLDRCSAKKGSSDYRHYVLRGIRVCKAWRAPNGDGLRAFITWNESLPKKKRWRAGLELDREDNDKGYSPKNCRWVPKSVNQRNKTTAIVVKEGPHKGRSFGDLHTEIAHRSVGIRTAKRRYQCYGWSAEDACAIPVNDRR